MMRSSWRAGEVLLFTDARQQIESPALRLLVENFADPDVGAASGELMLGDPAAGETGKGMGLYWRVEKKIRELESASGSVVGATGAIYCARRSLLAPSPLPEGTILDDVLMPDADCSPGITRSLRFPCPRLGFPRPRRRP
jgi:poly-beta-1,6-N-acetyl-D-glucosamine synthase